MVKSLWSSSRKQQKSFGIGVKIVSRERHGVLVIRSELES